MDREEAREWNKACQDFAAKRKGIDPTKGLPVMDTPIGRLAVSLREWPGKIVALGYPEMRGKRMYVEVSVERSAGRWALSDWGVHPPLIRSISIGENYCDVDSLFSIWPINDRLTLRRKIADAVVPAVARWAAEHPRDLERCRRDSYLLNLQVMARKGDPHFDDLDADVCYAIVDEYRGLMSGELKVAFKAAARAAEKYRREVNRISVLSRRQLRGRKRERKVA